MGFVKDNVYYGDDYALGPDGNVVYVGGGGSGASLFDNIFDNIRNNIPSNSGGSNIVDTVNTALAKHKVSNTQPPFVHTGGQKAAQANYIDYVRWKRKELENLLNLYRQGYPKQIEAYKTAAYGALPEKQKNLWGNMYANLNQRGLSESGSFLGGAKVDLENWLSGEKSNIESTAQGMEQSAQQAMLAALGKPNYAGLYQQWNDFDRMLNDAIYKNAMMDVKGDNN